MHIKDSCFAQIWYVLKTGKKRDLCNFELIAFGILKILKWQFVDRQPFRSIQGSLHKIDY